MSFVILLLFQISFASEVQVLLITSSSTPSFLKTMNKIDFNSEIFSVLLINDSEITESLIQSSVLAIDATFAIILSIKIENLCKQAGISYTSLYYIEDRAPNSKKSLVPSPLKVLSSLSKLLSWLAWSEFAIFSSEDSNFIASSETLLTESNRKSEFRYIITDDMQQSDIENMISKIIKPSSTKIFVIMANEEITTRLLNALNRKKLIGTGTGILIYSECLVQTSMVGLIYLVPKGLEKSTTTSTFYQLTITNLLKHIQNHLPWSYTQASINKLVSEFLLAEADLEYSVMNVQSSVLRVVGSVNQNQILITQKLIFPGGSQDFIRNYRTQIIFSYAGGQNNGPNVPATFFNPGQMLGAVFSAKVANNDSTLLPNFNFTPIYTDCGVNTNNQSYISECLNQSGDLGVGFLSTAWYPSTVPYFSYFSPKPVIGTDTSTEMSDKSAFPTFVRVTAPSTYNVVVLMTIIKIYGWKQVSLLCTNIPKFISMCEKFESLALNNNIKILNAKKFWKIENFYTKSRFEQDKQKMTEIIDSGARIFVALIPSADLFELVEGFYDLGMRAGDLQILFQSKTGAAICSGIEDSDICYKRKEIMTGTLGVYMAEWSGSYGQMMEKEIIKEVGSYTAFKCTAFDQGMLIVRSIASVINMGYDYEDPKVLNNYMRRNRFIGCSGTVSLSQDTNDRSNQPTYVSNMLVVNNTPSEVYTALYDPSSQNPFEILRPVVWTGQSEEVPSDYRFSVNCPFDETKAEDSSSGLKALYVICFIFGGFSGLVLVMYGKLIYKSNLEMITSKTLITGQDMAVFIVISIEVFQYFSLGVTPSDSSSLVKSISEITGINFRSFLYLEGNDYWNVILVVIIVSWIIQCISILIILRSKKVIILRSSLFNWLDFCAEYLMPLYGEIAFIPILSVIFNCFTCTKSVKSGITNSYNSHDCNTYCWTESHLSLSVLGITTLAVFLPSFTFLRPIWQDYQKTLNIKQNPRYSLYKSFFQIIAVILSKTVFYSDEILFGFLFSFYLLFYAFSLKFFKGYCYGIANLWLIFSIIIAGYTELLYTISLTSEFGGRYVAIALFLGWIILGLVCGFIQSKYFTAYLYSEPSKDIPEIFEYAFRNNGSKYIDEKQESQDNY